MKACYKATRIYAWSHLDGADDSDERFVAVLGVPPMDSAHRAVQVSIVADAKKGMKQLAIVFAVAVIVTACLWLPSILTRPVCTRGPVT